MLRGRVIRTGFCRDRLLRERIWPCHGRPAEDFSFFKNAMRVGEIRGGEAFDLLQLLNTGHAGTLSTIHASCAKQGLARFTSCVLQSGIDLPYPAIKTNIGDSLDVVVQIERRQGRRFISEVLEINEYTPDADQFDYCFA